MSCKKYNDRVSLLACPAVNSGSTAGQASSGTPWYYHYQRSRNGSRKTFGLAETRRNSGAYPLRVHVATCNLEVLSLVVGSWSLVIANALTNPPLNHRHDHTFSYKVPARR